MLCAAAFALAEGLIAVDRVVGEPDLPGWMSLVLYRVGESGSRDILGAIATSSLAVAGTTFSITIAVLALTSSSFGPRLVRNFMADRGNQTVLGVFVSTFLYSLITLRSVRVLGDPGNQEAEVFVPHLAVNVAVLLAVADVAVLVYFIHHISDSIQVSTIASRVRSELFDVVDRMYPAGTGAGPAPDDRATAQALSAVAERGAPVTAAGCGYVQSIRSQALVDAARRHDVLVALRIRPGQYVLDDTVTALVHPAGRVDDRLVRSIRSALLVTEARSPHQDPEFAVQQLTELAVRALSPGTNDPYTAVNALDDLSAGLARLAARTPPSPARVDDDGVLRVHAPGVSAHELVGSVVDAVRWYATSSPLVLLAALDALERIGARAAQPELRAALAEDVDLLEAAFLGADLQQHDVAALTARTAAVRAALAHAAPAPPATRRD